MIAVNKKCSNYLNECGSQSEILVYGSLYLICKYFVESALEMSSVSNLLHSVGYNVGGQVI